LAHIDFYAGDAAEPMHVHIERDEYIAKFWLDPIRLHNSGGFNRVEISKIHKIINEHHTKLLEAWNEYFSG
jgi:hypothetical protein